VTSAPVKRPTAMMVVHDVWYITPRATAWESARDQEAHEIVPQEAAATVSRRCAFPPVGGQTKDGPSGGEGCGDEVLQCQGGVVGAPCHVRWLLAHYVPVHHVDPTSRGDGSLSCSNGGAAPQVDGDADQF
jgi:hypothetical protein